MYIFVLGTQNFLTHKFHGYVVNPKFLLCIKQMQIFLHTLLSLSLSLSHLLDPQFFHICLMNKLPTSSLPNSSPPYFSLHKTTLNYKSLKLFGCSCFSLLRSDECIFMGISPHHKAYKCLNKEVQIFISKDVSFNECNFPYLTLFPPSTSTLSTQSVSPPLFLTKPIGYPTHTMDPLSHITTFNPYDMY